MEFKNPRNIEKDEKQNLTPEEEEQKNWLIYERSKNVLPYKQLDPNNFSLAYRVTKVFSEIFVENDVLDNKSRKERGKPIISNPNMSCLLYTYPLENGELKTCILMDCSGTKSPKYTQNISNFLEKIDKNPDEFWKDFKTRYKNYFEEKLGDIELSIVDSVSDTTSRELKIYDMLFPPQDEEYYLCQMKSVPSKEELEQYKQSYILVKSSTGCELHYITSKGEDKKLNINISKALFSTKKALSLSNDDVVNFIINENKETDPKKIDEIITDIEWQKKYSCSEPTLYVEAEKLIQQEKTILGTAHFSVWLNNDASFDAARFKPRPSCTVRCQKVQTGVYYLKNSDTKKYERVINNFYKNNIQRQLSTGRGVQLTKPKSLDELKQRMQRWDIRELLAFHDFVKSKLSNQDLNDKSQQLLLFNQIFHGKLRGNKLPSVVTLELGPSHKHGKTILRRLTNLKNAQNLCVNACIGKWLAKFTTIELSKMFESKDTNIIKNKFDEWLVASWPENVILNRISLTDSQIEYIKSKIEKLTEKPELAIITISYSDFVEKIKNCEDIGKLKDFIKAIEDHKSSSSFRIMGYTDNKIDLNNFTRGDWNKLKKVALNQLSKKEKSVLPTNTENLNLTVNIELPKSSVSYDKELELAKVMNPTGFQTQPKLQKEPPITQSLSEDAPQNRAVLNPESSENEDIKKLKEEIKKCQDSKDLVEFTKNPLSSSIVVLIKKNKGTSAQKKFNQELRKNLTELQNLAKKTLEQLGQEKEVNPAINTQIELELSESKKEEQMISPQDNREIQGLSPEKVLSQKDQSTIEEIVEAFGKQQINSDTGMLQIFNALSDLYSKKLKAADSNISQSPVNDSGVTQTEAMPDQPPMTISSSGVDEYPGTEKSPEYSHDDEGNPNLQKDIPNNQVNLKQVEVEAGSKPEQKVKNSVNYFDSSSIFKPPLEKPEINKYPVVFKLPATFKCFSGTSTREIEINSVYVAGSFNRWLNAENGKIMEGKLSKKHQMQKDEKTGEWRLTVHLPAGKHEFKYVINEGEAWTTAPGYIVGSSDGKHYNSIIDIHPAQQINEKDSENEETSQHSTSQPGANSAASESDDEKTLEWKTDIAAYKRHGS